MNNSSQAMGLEQLRDELSYLAEYPNNVNSAYLITLRDAIDAHLQDHLARREVEQCDAPCTEADGCPTELSVLKRFWRSHQSPRDVTVSDEDVERASEVFYEAHGQAKWEKLLDCWKQNYRKQMRAALLTLQADRQRVGGVASSEEVTRDPHHDGSCQWKWDGRKLWHRPQGVSKWTEVKRISFTRARILAIAAILTQRTNDECPPNFRPIGEVVAEHEKDPRKKSYLDAARERLTQRARPGWLPMESAPKSVADGRHVDGIYILGFVPADKSQDEPERIGVIWWEPLLIGKDGKRGKWVGDAFDFGVEVKPTHWMPLPSPPTHDDAEGV